MTSRDNIGSNDGGAPDLPGLYFDPVKRKYFPLTSQTIREQKKRKLAQRTRDSFEEVQRDRVQQYESTLLAITDVSQRLLQPTRFQSLTRNKNGPSEIDNEQHDTTENIPVAASFEKLEIVNSSLDAQNTKNNLSQTNSRSTKNNFDFTKRYNTYDDFPIDSIIIRHDDLYYISFTIDELGDFRTCTWQWNDDTIHYDSCLKFTLDEYNNDSKIMKRKNIMQFTRDSDCVYVVVAYPNDPELVASMKYPTGNNYHFLKYSIHDGESQNVPLSLPANKHISCSSFNKDYYIYVINKKIHTKKWPGLGKYTFNFTLPVKSDIITLSLFTEPSIENNNLTDKKRVNTNACKGQLVVGFRNGTIFYVPILNNAFLIKSGFIIPMTPFNIKTVVSLHSSNVSNTFLISSLSTSNEYQTLLHVQNIQNTNKENNKNDKINKSKDKKKIIKLITTFKNFTKGTEICDISSNGKFICYGTKGKTRNDPCDFEIFALSLANRDENGQWICYPMAKKKNYLDSLSHRHNIKTFCLLNVYFTNIFPIEDKRDYFDSSYTIENMKKFVGLTDAENNARLTMTFNMDTDNDRETMRTYDISLDIL